MTLKIYGIAASRAIRPLWAVEELGLAAGKIYDFIWDVIKLDNYKDFFSLYNDLDLSFVNNTAGVRSISKYELQSKLLEIGVSKYGHVPKCVVSSGPEG